MGAVARTRGGRTFSGCNVENSSYGLTVCAERNAIFSMVAAGHRDLDAIVIVTPGAPAAPPCGACRQVIYEFNPRAIVYSFGGGGSHLTSRVDLLLPFAFGPDSLPRSRPPVRVQ